MNSGAVAPVIEGRYDLADAADALRDLQAGRTNGKGVVIVRPA